MLAEIDHGVRCDVHAGEIFPPRCYDCQAAARAEDERTAPERFSRPIPPAPERRSTLIECETHPGYFAFIGQPCDRCVRDGEVTA